MGKFVRQGAVLADIGTDHGYLPLALLEAGVIERAICTDINESPLSSARENARARGLADRCEFILTDGAAALAHLGVTDAVIAGMGGELIADIISKAPFFCDTGVHLVLQPMSRQEKLRRYLAEAGFEITDEEYSFSSGKYYVTMSVIYTGVVRSPSLTEAYFGAEAHLLPLDEDKRGYILSRLSALRRSAEGKRRGGEGCDDEERLIEYAEKILKTEK